MSILDGSGPQTYHLGVGYSGWGAFQLDREIQEESWWLAPLDESLIMDMEYDHRWECILENLGISPYTALFTKSGQNVIPIGARRPSIPEKSASLSSTYQNMS